jgi:conjugal transfer pilus assembly protein TraW
MDRNKNRFRTGEAVKSEIWTGIPFLIVVALGLFFAIRGTVFAEICPGCYQGSLTHEIQDLDLMPDFDTMQMSKEWAEEILQQSSRQISEELDLSLTSPEIAASKSKVEIHILVTLGDEPHQNIAELRRLFQSIKLQAPEAIVSIRGLPAQARTINDLARIYYSIVKDGPEDYPGININPEIFKRNNVSVSPTLILKEGGETKAWATGIIGADWIAQEVASGETGYLGQFGPVMTVAEKCILKEINDRIAGLNFNDLLKKPDLKPELFLDLPVAKEDREFYITPTILVQDDIIVPNGKLIAGKGQRVNLLDQFTPSFYLIFFDARDARQVVLAKEIMSNAPDFYRVKLITAGVDIDEDETGWERWGSLEKKFNLPLFLMSQDLLNAFSVSRIPSSVVAEGKSFKITEYRVD